MTFDPKKPVRTRDGREVRIVCTDVNNSMPIIALVRADDGKEWIAHYSMSGTVYGYTQDKSDLVNIPERVERWANVCAPSQNAFCCQFDDKETANAFGEDVRCGLIKLVYEGDKLVEVTLEKSDD